MVGSPCSVAARAYGGAPWMVTTTFFDFSRCGHGRKSLSFALPSSSPRNRASMDLSVSGHGYLAFEHVSAVWNWLESGSLVGDSMVESG